MPLRVFITVAEVSGDHHAAGFIRALKQLVPDAIVEGFGGPAMAAAGATILYETTVKAAMTFHAVSRVFEFKRLLKQARDHYATHRPDLHVCIDSSGVNLHFARNAKAAGIPVLYYVAPQLWASREGRMKKLRKSIDQLACIFPFEEMYFRRHGVHATFVGHPLFDTLPPNRFDRPTPQPISADRPAVVGIVPGSRRAEVKENLARLIEVMHRIHTRFPGTTFHIPTTEAADEMVREQFATTPFKVVIKKDAFDELVAPCDLCITKSGTSTVHVAAWCVPMIVVYKVSPVLWHLAGRWLVRTRKIAMVNILAGQKDLVPEFIPWYGPTEPVAACAIDLLSHPEKLASQRAALRDLIAPLDHRGASLNVAKLALDMIEHRDVVRPE